MDNVFYKEKYLQLLKKIYQLILLLKVLKIVYKQLIQLHVYIVKRILKMKVKIQKHVLQVQHIIQKHVI